jgi:hypothetical protein
MPKKPTGRTYPFAVPSNFNTVYKAVLKFCIENQKKPTPGDAAKGLTIEAAHLLAKYKWDETRMDARPKHWPELELAAASVFWELLLFFHGAGIDPIKALQNKLGVEHNLVVMSARTTKARIHN